MNETPFDPEHPPDETDRTLDLYLASLSRFDPSPAFAEQVMARVVVVRPAMAVQRWPRARSRTFAALSGAAAASSTALTAWVATNFEALTATAMPVAAAWGLATWQAILASVPAMSAWAGEQLAVIVTTAGPGPVAGVVAGAMLSIPISMFGLYLAARPPLHPRMVTHAAP
jgi:hypothetical protein